MQINHIYVLGNVSAFDDVYKSTTYILYDNKLPILTPSLAEDFAMLYDGITSVFYSKAATSYTLDFTTATAFDANCIAFAGCNFKSANATITAYLKDPVDGSWSLAQAVTASRDNQPVMVTFEELSTKGLRLVVTHNGTLQIGEVAVGVALRMPVAPSVGYTPARWNVQDEITWSATENNNIGRSNINSRPAKEVLPFKLIPHSYMRSDWQYFIDAAKGLPVWVGWNQADYPSECIYGHWEQTESKYDTAIYSSFTLTIKGNV